MFTEIKTRENELRNREEELERISMRQQAYENMLRQRERELEEREKDLVMRELTVALQQLKPMHSISQQHLPTANIPPTALYQAPPEPKKRRKVGGRLLTNFLRSSNSITHNNSNSTTSVNAGLATAKSIDISSPSDFQHCLSVQSELMGQSSSSVNFLSSLANAASSSLKPSCASTPTDEMIDGVSTTSNTHIILSPVANGSPNLRLRIVGKYLNSIK